MRAFQRIWTTAALASMLATGCALLWPQRVEEYDRSLRFFQDDTLVLVVNREVRFRTVVIGSGDNTHSSTLYYYLLGFRVCRASGHAELVSIHEVYRRHMLDNSVPFLQNDQLAPLVCQKEEILFLAKNSIDPIERPAGATRVEVRRWNGSLWYLVRRNGEPDTVTNEDRSVTYTCPPLDIIRPNWDCWDADAGLILLTAGAYTPSYEFSHLPPKVYLWYYRENRVETYTIDRVAVDKALRRFIRQHD
jgi:hypothetical protein